MYSVEITGAERVVEQARQANAADVAPYEFYFAEENLRKAREEAAEASYQDAVRYAGLAEENASKARDLARRRMREQGP